MLGLMSPVVRSLRSEEVPTFLRREGRAFGIRYSADDIVDIPKRLDPARIIVAEVDSEIVGGAGVFVFPFTLPGGRVVQATGVTFVFVASTHRRQGVLRLIMNELHRAADAHNEPLQLLTASEGGIYERFGYGVATEFRTVQVRRDQAKLRADAPRGGSTEFIDDAQEAMSVASAVWERYAAVNVAGQSLQTSWWQFLLGPIGDKVAGGPQEVVVHRDDNGVADGLAIFRWKAGWDEVDSIATVEVSLLVALHPTAEVELWRLLLGLDLAVRIDADIAPDGLLPWIVENPRAVRTVAIRDHLWARVGRPAELLTARNWAGHDDLVVELAGHGRFTLAGEATDQPVDIVLPESTFGSCLLGAFSPTTLAAAGRLRATSTSSLERFEHAVRLARSPFLHRHF